MGSVTNMVLTFDAENSLKLVELCRQLTEERDTLAAELAKVRAALPKWRDEGVWRFLMLGALQLTATRSRGGEHIAWINGKRTVCHTREAAMLAVTTALGLPPCEVEGE